MENQDQLLSEKEVQRLSRVHERVTTYLSNHNRSLEQEMALVEAKKSNLSKAERDYVVLAHRFESLQPKDKEEQVDQA